MEQEKRLLALTARAAEQEARVLQRNSDYHDAVERNAKVREPAVPCPPPFRRLCLNTPKIVFSLSLSYVRLLDVVAWDTGDSAFAFLLRCWTQGQSGAKHQALGRKGGLCV